MHRGFLKGLHLKQALFQSYMDIEVFELKTI